MLVRTLLGGAILFAAGAASAQDRPDPAPEARLYRVGATGIHCYREPCPRKGIVPAEGPRRLHPLWSGTAPPVMRGDAEDRRRVAAAWDEGGCVIVRGSLLADAVLQVEEVKGPC